MVSIKSRLLQMNVIDSVHFRTVQYKIANFSLRANMPGVECGELIE